MTVLTDELRYHLLKKLEKKPDLTQRELADSLGISVGKTNYCINALINKGWIKARNFRNSQNKLSYVYLLTKKGLEEKTRVTIRFLKYKQCEYDELVREIELLRKEVASFEESVKDE